jgi:hypothetical protein
MFLIKKFIPAALAFSMLLSLTGCEESFTTTTPADEVVYNTIEPPEDGWTLDLLNEVTYINGQDID